MMRIYNLRGKQGTKLLIEALLQNQLFHFSKVRKIYNIDTLIPQSP